MDYVKVFDSDGVCVGYEEIVNGGRHPDGLTGPAGDWFWVSEKEEWSWNPDEAAGSKLTGITA